MNYYSYKCPQCGHSAAYSSIYNLLKLKTVTCPVCGVEAPIFKEEWKK